MPDYAGAVVAIRTRLSSNWATSRITYQNEQPASPWPPMDGSGVLQGWINLEISGAGSEIASFGKSGDRAWRYDGLIMVHVFQPVGQGAATAFQWATTIGEIFRAAKFYDDTPGYCVRTLSPMVDGGGDGDDDGNWFRVTMSVEFTYWHRG